MDDLVQFVRDRLADKVKWARESGNLFVTRGAPSLAVPAEVAEGYARSRVEAAETQVAFFEETVCPYLGTAGPTGRIAEQQLRLIASMFASHEAYDESWRP